MMWIKICLICPVILSSCWFQVAVAAQYCREPLTSGTDVTCIPGKTYNRDLKLCCSSTQLTGDKKYDQLPQTETLPHGCEHALTGDGPRCASSFIYIKERNICCPDTNHPATHGGRVLPAGTHGILPGGIGREDLLNGLLGGGGISGLGLSGGLPLSGLSGVGGQYCDVPIYVGVHPVCPPTHPFDPARRQCCGSVPISGAGYAQGSAGLYGAGCVDKKVAGRPSDCPANRNLCDEPLYRDLMTEQCPRTCHRCGQVAAYSPGLAYAQGALPVPISPTACSDKAVPGRPSDCPAMTHLCLNPAYYDLMTHQCPMTCGRCGLTSNFQPTPAPLTSMPDMTSTMMKAPSTYQYANVPTSYPAVRAAAQPNGISGCTDNIGLNGVSECFDKKHLCTDSAWRDFMAKECQFTCKTCPHYTGANLNLGSLPSLSAAGTGGIIVPPGLKVSPTDLYSGIPTGKKR